MEWLQFQNISFSQDSNIGQLCEIDGQGIYYDTFEIQDTKWFWFVSNMVTALINEKTLFGCFGMYPSFVAGILNRAERIHFFVLCFENLNYEYCIEKFIGDKECSVSYKAGHLFQISYHGVAFQARIFPNRPSELMFAQSVLKNKIQLGCLVYGIITVKGRVTCITNEVLSSRHNYVFEAYFSYYDSPVKLANCKACIRHCPLHPDDTCFGQVMHPFLTKTFL